MSKYTAFVFDLDGTLVSIPVEWGSVREDLRAIFETSDSFSPLFKSLARFLLQEPGLRVRVFEIMDKRELAALPTSSLMVGVLPTLAELSESAKLSLVTLQGRKACEALLTRFGLTRFFPRFFTREDSLERSQQIELARGQFEARRGQVLFVGDRLNDINAAREAGVDVAIIGSRGEEAKPDFRFATMVEFRSHFSKR